MLENERIKKLMNVVSKCIQETELKNNRKEINPSLECAEEPRYKNIDEVTNHFYDCKRKNCWENFDFIEVCEWLEYEIDDILGLFGQCDEEFYVTRNLDINFPGWTTLYPGHYHEPGYGMQLAVKKAAEEGNRYCLFQDPITACEEIETIWFRKLEKEYENDPDILNLKTICEDLSNIVLEEGHSFSQNELIAMIDRALHSKHPKGLVFELKL